MAKVIYQNKVFAGTVDVATTSQAGIVRPDAVYLVMSDESGNTDKITFSSDFVTAFNALVTKMAVLRDDDYYDPTKPEIDTFVQGSVDQIVADAIAELSAGTFQVVDSIASVTNPKKGIIYLVKDATVTGDDKYKEYIATVVPESDPEELTLTCIGDTSIDLSTYLQYTDFDVYDASTNATGAFTKTAGDKITLRSTLNVLDQDATVEGSVDYKIKDLARVVNAHAVASSSSVTNAYVGKFAYAIDDSKIYTWDNTASEAVEVENVFCNIVELTETQYESLSSTQKNSDVIVWMVADDPVTP